MCGKNLSSDTVSTIGQQRQFNYALQISSRPEFVATLTKDQPQAPGYFAHDVAFNRREHEIMDRVLEQSLEPLSLEQVLESQQAGTQVVDVRDPGDFARGHLAGSLSIGLSGKYATWAGTVLAVEDPVVIVASPGREREAAMRLGRIGFDQVIGFLDDGPAAFAKRGDLVATTRRVTATELAQQLADGAAAPLVLDVRGCGEWQDRHIEGSMNVPLPELAKRLAEVPKERAIVIHCLSGYRSMVAASLLERAGYGPMTDLEGGIQAWEQARLQVVGAPA
jgi:rhodanese-related sulfurtransferase